MGNAWRRPVASRILQSDNCEDVPSARAWPDVQPRTSVSAVATDRCVRRKSRGCGNITIPVLHSGRVSPLRLQHAKKTQGETALEGQRHDLWTCGPDRSGRPVHPPDKDPLSKTAPAASIDPDLARGQGEDWSGPWRLGIWTRGEFSAMFHHVERLLQYARRPLLFFT